MGALFLTLGGDCPKWTRQGLSPWGHPIWVAPSHPIWSSRATRSGALTTTDDLSCGRRWYYPNVLCFSLSLPSVPGCGALALALGKMASVSSLFCSPADRLEAANSRLAPQATENVPAPLLPRTALLEWFGGVGTISHAFRDYGVRTHAQAELGELK